MSCLGSMSTYHAGTRYYEKRPTLPQLVGSGLDYVSPQTTRQRLPPYFVRMGQFYRRTSDSYRWPGLAGGRAEWVSD